MTSAVPERIDRVITSLAAGVAVDVDELIGDQDRDVLLRLALGEVAVRRERRFRNVHTGETAEQLDLREHDFADWEPQERTVVETEWRGCP